jgi:hypothetical protein
VIRWEYKIVNPRKVNLNDLGRDGWEFVTATYDTHAETHWAWLRRQLEAG